MTIYWQASVENMHRRLNGAPACRREPPNYLAIQQHQDDPGRAPSLELPANVDTTVPHRYSVLVFDRDLQDYSAMPQRQDGWVHTLSPISLASASEAALHPQSVPG